MEQRSVRRRLLESNEGNEPAARRLLESNEGNEPHREGKEPVAPRESPWKTSIQGSMLQRGDAASEDLGVSLALLASNSHPRDLEKVPADDPMAYEELAQHLVLAANRVFILRERDAVRERTAESMGVALYREREKAEEIEVELKRMQEENEELEKQLQESKDKFKAGMAYGYDLALDFCGVAASDPLRIMPNPPEDEDQLCLSDAEEEEEAGPSSPPPSQDPVHPAAANQEAHHGQS